MSDTVDAKNSYPGNCEAEAFLKLLAQEWMSHIVAALARGGPLRFGQLRRALPGPISARVLSARLKELEAGGFVTRRELAGKVRHVEYALTGRGRSIDSALERLEHALPEGVGAG